MDFSELDYQSKVRDSLNKILADKCSQDQLKNFDDGFRHDEVLLSLLAKNGYLGLGINEEFGGSGEDLYDLGILFERLGYYAAPLSLTGCLVDVAQTIQKLFIDWKCLELEMNYTIWDGMHVRLVMVTKK